MQACWFNFNVPYIFVTHKTATCVVNQDFHAAGVRAQWYWKEFLENLELIGWQAHQQFPNQEFRQLCQLGERWRMDPVHFLKPFNRGYKYEGKRKTEVRWNPYNRHHLEVALDPGYAVGYEVAATLSSYGLLLFAARADGWRTAGNSEKLRQYLDVLFFDLLEVQDDPLVIAMDENEPR